MSHRHARVPTNKQTKKKKNKQANKQTNKHTSLMHTCLHACIHSYTLTHRRTNVHTRTDGTDGYTDIYIYVRTSIYIYMYVRLNICIWFTRGRNGRPWRRLPSRQRQKLRALRVKCIDGVNEGQRKAGYWNALQAKPLTRPSRAFEDKPEIECTLRETDSPRATTVGAKPAKVELCMYQYVCLCMFVSVCMCASSCLCTPMRVSVCQYSSWLRQCPGFLVYV